MRIINCRAVGRLSLQSRTVDRIALSVALARLVVRAMLSQVFVVVVVTGCHAARLLDVLAVDVCCVIRIT